ncbi:MAG: cysteine synthase family protein [Clostridia bacterium]|jgi:cysteine synthase|nr:cysteine synthase family protein [Clostridia bacterium]
MKYINDIKELIGNTPLMKLHNMGLKKGVHIFAKLECFNPGGSVKDRIGMYMIEGAEKAGLLKPGYTIVEATAGNTGLGVAMAALNKGYHILFVVPTKFSMEKQVLMRALGASVINTPREKGMLGAVEKAKELLAEIPNSISLEQFQNPNNPLAHYEGTAPEIYEALEGKIDYYVGGAGSGGTYSGVMKYFREKNAAIKGILADPVGSTMGGGEAACYNIEGIGNDFIPATMDMSLVDEVIKINDNEALKYTKLLAAKEGLIVGLSSGAALAAAMKMADRLERGNIVTLFSDRGDRYLSKGIFD